MPLKSERQLHMIQSNITLCFSPWPQYHELLEARWKQLAQWGTYRVWTQICSSVPVVQFTSCECLDTFLRNFFYTFILFCIGRFIHSSDILEIKPGSVVCRTSALPVVLFLQSMFQCLFKIDHFSFMILYALWLRKKNCVDIYLSFYVLCSDLLVFFPSIHCLNYYSSVIKLVWTVWSFSIALAIMVLL